MEDIDEEMFVPIDFCMTLDKHFYNVIPKGNPREISGKDFSINYFYDTEPVSNKIFSLYGENGTL